MNEVTRRERFVEEVRSIMESHGDISVARRRIKSLIAHDKFKYDILPKWAGAIKWDIYQGKKESIMREHISEFVLGGIKSTPIFETCLDATIAHLIETGHLQMTRVPGKYRTALCVAFHH